MTEILKPKGADVKYLMLGLKNVLIFYRIESYEWGISCNDVFILLTDNRMWKLKRNLEYLTYDNVQHKMN